MKKNYANLSPKNFLYERKGPWPQPSPAHPIGEAAAVIHLPCSEKIDWWLHIGSRYMLTLLYTPIAYLKGIINPGLAEVSNAEFMQLFQHSMLSKFICEKFDQNELELFKNDMKTGEKYFYIDMTPVKVVKPFPGIYCSGTKTLIREIEKNKYEVIAIWVEKTNEIIHPNDPGFELAKYYVLQGGALCATLVIHPLLHFPLDAINAISKTALPTDHLLFKLLHPHTRFTLPLENAVLTFKTSLLQAKWWMPYAPYPGDKEGLRELLVEGYMGLNNESSYPQFFYPSAPPKVFSTYGEFQDAYFAVVKKYVAKVLAEIEPDDYYVKCWANWIAQYVPGFPNGEQIFQGTKFVDAVSFYLWSVTVGHTIDHYDYGHMDIRKVPLRLRQAPPRKNDKVIDRSKLTTFWDNGKYTMANILFFNSTVVTPLITTEYEFSDTKLLNAVEEFKKDLRQVDSEMKARGICYIPLDEIARSIQS